MWHTTDVAPREGAKVVAMNAEIGTADFGEIKDGMFEFDAGDFLSDYRIVSLSVYTHWAYAPGEAE